MSKIFGGSKSKSQQTSQNVSYNKAYEPISSGFMPGATSAFNAGTTALNAELGGGFDAYRKKSGFDFMAMLGLDKIAGNRAGRGSFQSGAAMKALADYEDNISRASYNNYLDKLLQQANLGLQGGSLVSGTGGYSQGSSQGTSTSKSSPGIGQFIGQIAAGAAASDPRLKKDVERIGTLKNGLGLYKYMYIHDVGPFIGVMADEVRDKMPEALGPEVGGYLTVDYSKIVMEIVDESTA